MFNCGLVVAVVERVKLFLSILFLLISIYLGVSEYRGDPSEAGPRARRGKLKTETGRGNEGTLE